MVTDCTSTPCIQPVELGYVSAGCNLTPRALDWQCSSNLIAYCSHSSVHIYQPKVSGDGGKVIQTLSGHKGRVNAVRWLNSINDDVPVPPELISASSDSTVKVWSYIDGKFVNTSVLKDHDGAVNDVTGLLFTSESNVSALIASTASDFSIKLWRRDQFRGDFVLVDSINLKNSLCVALELSSLPGRSLDSALLALSTESFGVQLYSVTIRSGERNPTNKLITLVGHEDWVRGLSFVSLNANSEMFLASSSQDASVRVWKISLDNSTSSTTLECDSIDSEFKMEKKSFELDSETFSVSLETVLLGHEGWVYAAKWFPSLKGSRLQLMTFSFDHTIILWSPDEEAGFWFERARMGNVGGEALGFLGGAIGPNGSSVIAHTHQGSLNLWTLSEEVEDRWCPKPVCGGHFGEVTDIAWEPNGHYLLSVSADQTTRLHAQLFSLQNGRRDLWYEMARPQIHGYGMNSIAALPDFKFVSAADEKVARAFAAPRNSLENLRSLSGLNITDTFLEKCSEPMGATVPALGLSNKAVFTEESEVTGNKKGQNDESASYFTRQLLKEPPTDDFLSQNSLWPEIMKLYGHGYDVYSVAASHNGRFVATACKATAAEHARIILWDTDTWEKIHDFEGSGHSLTVTQMSFSPDDTFLLSVSRDRNWVIHNNNEGLTSYKRLACSDKRTGVHSRIIWTCGWSHDSALFATASREGMCAIWSASNLLPSEGKNEVSIATKDWLAGSTKTFPESVTAVAFSPRLLSDKCGSSYLLAIGTESGLLCLTSFTLGESDPWKVLSSIDNYHSATITRVAFRPARPSRAEVDDELTLATSSYDHSIKIFYLHPSISSSI